jgi:hypothetical protein
MKQASLLGRILVATIILATPVLAAPTVTPKGTQQASTTVCSKVSTGVDGLTQRYTQTRETYNYRYREMYENMTQLMTRLNEKGYDTTALGEDLNTLNQYIVDFDGYHEQFMNMLQETKSYACDDQLSGQYRSKAEEARGVLRQMRETAQNTYQLLKEEIKQDLLDLKEQTP